MARTEEQKQADARLYEAIVATDKAYRTEESVVGVVTDYIVVAAVVKPDMEDPDEDMTAYSVLMSGGGMPYYRSQGLLKAGMKCLDLQFEGSEDDGLV